MTACPSCGASVAAEARFCPNCAAPLEIEPTSEERKVATVLFADLVGSTEQASDVDPERTRALLGRFYDAMSAEISAAGGTVEKFAGDAVMAAFGAPAAHEDHAERALHAALSMQRRLEQLFGDRLALRIGVNTGEVVVGTPREGSSFVSGDAVNIAARLEQAADPGEILVGERTAQAVRGAFDLTEPFTVEAKGKPGGVVASRLVQALSLARPRGVAGSPAAFVGRDSELEALKAAYTRVVAERRPHLVTILGEPGVGKTRLVREFWDWLGAEAPQVLRRTGRCMPYGHGKTYVPVGEIVREHFGLLESDPPETVHERLGDRVMLGMTLGFEAPTELHPLAARDRLHTECAEFFAELASSQSAVALVEDVHWAEPPLLDLLDSIVRDVEGPLVVLATARPEFVDAPRTWRDQLWLEALTPTDAERMLDAIFPGKVSDEVRRAVLERAEGNPFFVEELVEAVRDAPEDAVIPDSVQAVLASRIDRLGPPEKAALQAASVIGRVFWSGPLYELLEGLEPDLRLLEERDFIRRQPGS
jgi:class 3 adenylate cyclase